MALQLTHVFSIFFTIYLSFSSCYGRNLQSLGADYAGLGIRHVRRSLLAAKTFNVNDFGAKGDGKTDDTKAFIKAWNEACSTPDAVFRVPSKNKYLVKPITFNGPCKSALTVQIVGKILASKRRSDYEENTRHWIVFKGINYLSVIGDGGGSIDGNGKIWWDNSCKIKKSNPCRHAPTALLFQECENLVVRNLKVQNGQQMQLSFERCNQVRATGLSVTSPEYSPNTDGIHITDSQNVEVARTFIGTGDDCISIEDGTKNVRATDITCGPGHGISIGSLGDKDTPAHVSDIIVDGATLTKTTNGLRIKTYQGGSGIASNIQFRNIKLNDVDNPIIINQKYCDREEPCEDEKSAVQVQHVVYENIKGTSSSKAAVNFDCSASYPCQDITMNNIQIKNTDSGKAAQATCNNVQLSKVVDVSPQCSD